MVQSRAKKMESIESALSQLKSRAEMVDARLEEDRGRRIATDEVEMKNTVLGRGTPKQTSRFGSAFSKGPNKGVGAEDGPIPSLKIEERDANGPRQRGPSHLSNEEYKEKRAKGLCFFCDEQFTTDHVCKNKNFRLLIIEEPVESAELAQSEWVDQSSTVEMLESHVELRLMSSAGHLRSIRAWMDVRGRKVRVLIDCRASHNFISSDILAELGLEVDSSSQFVVKVDDRSRIPGQGRCLGVELKFLEFSVVEDFFVFSVDEAEFVLGLAWLDKLGDMSMNFKNSCLRFYQGDSLVKLQGDPDLCYGSLACKSAVVAACEGEEAFLV